MLFSKQILVIASILGASMVNLTGCGQTGALYLPAPHPPVNLVPSAAGNLPAPEVETEEKSSPS
jgi:predicted small lipoprotein YifL